MRLAARLDARKRRDQKKMAARIARGDKKWKRRTARRGASREAGPAVDDPRVEKAPVYDLAEKVGMPPRKVAGWISLVEGL